jgi:hypothetical protein
MKPIADEGLLVLDGGDDDCREAMDGAADAKVVSPRDKPKLTTILHQPEELDQVPNIRNIFKIFRAYRVLPSPQSADYQCRARGNDTKPLVFPVVQTRRSTLRRSKAMWRRTCPR